MSKMGKAIFVLVLAVSIHFEARAQEVYFEGSITFYPARQAAVVSGKWAGPVRSRRGLSFLNSAIGAPGLGRRISEVKMSDAAGEPVAFKAFNAAEYVAEKEFSAFSYVVDLRTLADRRSAAHASWIGAETGLIFLDDVLPLVPDAGKAGARIAITVPDSWKLAGAQTSRPDRVYEFANVGRSAFVIGKELRQMDGQRGNSALTLIIGGQWLFTDAEASAMAAEIYDEYKKIFGGAPVEHAYVVLLPMPQAGVSKGVWEAETRGSTVVVTSSDMPFRTQSLQRLHEQLRHEIFHLWLPNGVNLTGRYDWFYEGFALYQSLKTGVATNRIRFEDMLDTLSRARNIDAAITPRRSLIEASRERWSGADTQLYARGMAVAFLADLVLLERSNGKRSIENILHDIFAANRPPAEPADGNMVVLKRFEQLPELAGVVADHIKGAKPIAWNGIIEGAGLEEGPGIVLRIKRKISGKQKALLDKLGYNNWRKLTQQ